MEQLIFHLLGDYITQTDWQAQNKKVPGKTGLIACLLHCTLYSTPFLLVASPIQVLLIFIFHFMIDRWYFVKWFMKANGQNDFAKPPFAPWSIIVVDNTFHLLCNYLIIRFAI